METSLAAAITRWKEEFADGNERMEKLFRIFYEHGGVAARENKIIVLGSQRVLGFQTYRTNHNDSCFYPESFESELVESVIDPKKELTTLEMDEINAGFICGAIAERGKFLVYSRLESPKYLTDLDLWQAASEEDLNTPKYLSGTIGEIAILMRAQYTYLTDQQVFPDDVEPIMQEIRSGAAHWEKPSFVFFAPSTHQNIYLRRGDGKCLSEIKRSM